MSPIELIERVIERVEKDLNRGRSAIVVRASDQGWLSPHSDYTKRILINDLKEIRDAIIR